jgi:hypothetical protein
MITAVHVSLPGTKLPRRELPSPLSDENRTSEKDLALQGSHELAKKVQFHGEFPAVRIPAIRPASSDFELGASTHSATGAGELR